MSRRKAEPGRRAHGGTYSTLASEAPCQRCRRPLLYAWDEGVIARADAAVLDLPVALALRDLGRRIYVRTEGGWLVHESVERYGSLRLARTRHVEHACPAAPPAPVVENQQLEIFDLERVRPPARRREGER